MKYFAGLDVSLQETAICIVDEDGIVVREGKAAFDKQVILPVALGPRRLRPAVIHADTIAGGDPLHHAVEHLPSILSLIEA